MIPNPECVWTADGLGQLLDAMKDILDYCEVGLGTWSEEGEIIEASWTGYERAVIVVSLVTLAGGEQALAADVSFDGPTIGYGEFDAIFVAAGSTKIGTGRWEAIQRIPASGVGRWRMTFRV